MTFPESRLPLPPGNEWRHGPKRTAGALPVRKRGSRVPNSGSERSIRPLVARPQPWQLTRDAFSRLLAALSPDVEVAGARYEELRRALLRFFEWRGAWDPEARTDETLDPFGSNGTFRSRRTSQSDWTFGS